MIGVLSFKKEGRLIIVITYQSSIVLRILQSGKIYHAKRSLRFNEPYSALVDILQLHCACPIFGCLKFHRQCTNGRVSSSVKLTLDVPKEKVKLTEYSVWADFMYYIINQRPTHYSRVTGGSSEMTQKKLNKIIHSLKKQRNPWFYRVPQVVLEEIRPEWIIKYQKGKLL